jgi:hypothetical protein
LCPQEDCLKAAEKQRAFARSFRGPVTLDPAVRAVFAGPGKMRLNHDSPHDSKPAAAEVRRSRAASHHGVPAATIDERR